jgi:hypothetical protein
MNRRKSMNSSVTELKNSAVENAPTVANVLIKLWSINKGDPYGVFYAYGTTAWNPPNGYREDGSAFVAAPQTDKNAVPVYRFVAKLPDAYGTKFAYALEGFHEDGWANEGVAFYAYQSGDVPDSVPVHQWWASRSDIVNYGVKYCYGLETFEPGPGWVRGKAVYWVPRAEKYLA